MSNYENVFSGADDIFVFTNTWKHVRSTEPHLPVVEQLRQALYQGGKAMVSGRLGPYEPL